SLSKESLTLKGGPDGSAAVYDIAGGIETGARSAQAQRATPSLADTLVLDCGRHRQRTTHPARNCTLGAFPSRRAVCGATARGLALAQRCDAAAGPRTAGCRAVGAGLERLPPAHGTCCGGCGGC